MTNDKCLLPDYIQKAINAKELSERLVYMAEKEKPYDDSFYHGKSSIRDEGEINKYMELK